MKSQGILVVAVVLLAFIGKKEGGERPNPARDERLRKELLDRVEKDQSARKALIDLVGGSKDIGPDHPDMKKLKEIDRQNTMWLKKIVEQYGWPGKSLVGEDGAHSAWLLIQHADQDVPFQKRSLELLKAAVKQGEASPRDFAYLTDRVRIAEKKKQLYGTQFIIVEGKFKPHPIEDEENVDDRRKGIGLEPLADYLKSAEEMYLPKKHEKRE
ncbi:MAG: DUF6624 domain-containing protein [Thermoguttaceae bacterium]|jgi:hypothetical protein